MEKSESTVQISPFWNTNPRIGFLGWFLIETFYLGYYEHDSKFKQLWGILSENRKVRSEKDLGEVEWTKLA